MSDQSDAACVDRGRAMDFMGAAEVVDAASYDRVLAMLSSMTDSRNRAVELVNECDDKLACALARATRAESELASYMRDEMVRVSVNLAPAAMEGKIREKLIQLGWTPPHAPR